MKLFTILVLLIASKMIRAADSDSYRVMSLKGKVDFIAQTMAQRPLSVGVFLRPNSKLILTPGSQISLLGPREETIHFAGQTSIELTTYGVQLRYGSMWLSSHQEQQMLYIESPNGMIQFKRMEGIITYDTVLKKTQVFVISGNAMLANAYIPDKRENLVSGEISFVQRDFQQGLPRKPSLIGKESMHLLLSQFKGIDSRSSDEEFQKLLVQLSPDKTKQDDEELKRGIASIGPGPQKTRDAADLYKGSDENKIMFIPKNMKKMIHEIADRKIASKEILPKKRKRQISKEVPIRVMRFDGKGDAANKDHFHQQVFSDNSRPDIKITAPMQAQPQEKKSVDYMRNPSSQDGPEDAGSSHNTHKSSQEKELNLLLEQLRQVEQDQNEHY
ncbi:MAG: hypothetical protein QE271_13120 [Bacteriovoracaceae bacterium]|nr:hypothetical protein [Bacteriovoracaceae bacterium]